MSLRLLYELGKQGLVESVFIAAHAQELRKNIMPLGLKTGYTIHRRRVLRQADGVFPVSHYTGQLLKDDGVDADRIHVVPNGTEVARFMHLDRQAARKRFRSGYNLGNALLIGTVARLVPRKGIDTVIESMPRLLNECPELRYVIVGAGDDEQRLQKLAIEFNVSKQCVFLGRIPYDDLPRAYCALDCFVMPARQIGSSVEGFGLVFCEASACGTPVLAHTLEVFQMRLLMVEVVFWWSPTSSMRSFKESYRF